MPNSIDLFENLSGEPPVINLIAPGTPEYEGMEFFNILRNMRQEPIEEFFHDNQEGEWLDNLLQNAALVSLT